MESIKIIFPKIVRKQFDEMYPLFKYTVGDPMPRPFSRGKRGIAGSVVCLKFGEEVHYDVLKEKVCRE